MAQAHEVEETAANAKVMLPQNSGFSVDSWHGCQVDACIAQSRVHSISCGVLFWHGHYSNMSWLMPCAYMQPTTHVMHSSTACIVTGVS